MFLPPIDDPILKLAKDLRTGNIFDGRIYKPPRKPLKEKSPTCAIKYKAKCKIKNKIARMSRRKNR